MEEVDRIKYAFARYSVPVPSSSIERAVYIPEDRPFPECAVALPSSTDGLFRDPRAPTAAKGKKAAAKKGGAKKGGKKKKK